MKTYFDPVAYRKCSDDPHTLFYE